MILVLLLVTFTTSSPFDLFLTFAFTPPTPPICQVQPTSMICLSVVFGNTSMPIFVYIILARDGSILTSTSLCGISDIVSIITMFGLGYGNVSIVVLSTILMTEIAEVYLLVIEF